MIIPLILLISLLGISFLIQGKYEEEIYSRAEHQFADVQAQLGWLSSFKGKPGNAYEKDAVLVAESLQRSIEIGTQAKEAEADVDKLRGLSTELGKLKFKDSAIEDVINSSLSTAENVEKEEDRIIKEIQAYADKLDKIKDLPEQELKDLYKSRGNKEEHLLSGIALDEENPNSLRSYKGWETRRAKEAFRRLF